MNDLINKLTLERLEIAATVYNEQRLHRPFQAAEVYKFLDYLYKQYGLVNPHENSRNY